MRPAPADLPNDPVHRPDCAGHRRVILPFRRQLAGQHRHRRLVAQIVMVDPDPRNPA